MKDSNPKKILITPYHKPEEDITGRQTKILLYPERIEYKIKYDFKAIVEDEITGETKRNLYVDEEGFINKTYISSISKYIDNDTSQIETDKRPIVEVGHISGNLYISCINDEEQTKLYKELLTWYWDE